MMSSEHTKGKRKSTYDKHTDRKSGKTYRENRNNNRGDKTRCTKRSLIPTKERGSNGKKNNTIKG